MAKKEYFIGSFNKENTYKHYEEQRTVCSKVDNKELIEKFFINNLDQQDKNFYLKMLSQVFKKEKDYATVDNKFVVYCDVKENVLLQIIEVVKTIQEGK